MQRISGLQLEWGWLDIPTVNLTKAGFAIISSVSGETSKNDHSSSSFVIPPTSTSGTRYLLLKYNSLTGNDAYRELSGATVTINAVHNRYQGTVENGQLSGKSLDKEFDPSAVTYGNFGDVSSGLRIGDFFTGSAEITGAINSTYVKNLLKYGYAITARKGTGTTQIYTNVSMSVELGDYVYQKITNTLVNGYAADKYTLNKTQPATFTVSLSPSVSSNLYLDLPAITSVKFRYRAKSASTYTEKNCGTTLSYEMPGNLMPTGEMEYQWVVADSLGHTETSEWISVKTESNAFYSSSPTGNVFINRYKDAFFSYSTYPGVSVTKFRYRKSGASSYTEVSVNDALKGYTLPANTIKDGAEYEYLWVGVDQYNISYTYGWFEFNTIDATSSAETIFPVSSLVDSDEAITFRWNHIISTGSAQTKAELQKSNDGNTWSSLLTITGAATNAELPSGTFTSGAWYWRVRTYNADNSPGSWSDPAQFIAIASPSTPIISVQDNSPKPTITWQVSEQAAYEVILDGIPSKYYGTEKIWTSQAYLSDGQHSICVRAQNSYGRWSAIGEVIITVVNSPGEPITLSADGGKLWWGSTEAYDHYLIYRDMKIIAQTQEMYYVDNTGNGAVSYQVRGCYADSNNYGLSNAENVEIKSEYYIFYDMEFKSALEVRHCGLRNQQVTRNNERDISFIHIPGREYPAVERSEFRDENMNGAAVFFFADEAERFNALSGRLVCIKTPDGKSYIGILNGIEITPTGLRYDCVFKLTSVSAELRYAEVNLATFDIDPETGSLIMTSSDNYGGPEFSINAVGDLEVNYD